MKIKMISGICIYNYDGEHREYYIESVPTVGVESIHFDGKRINVDTGKRNFYIDHALPTCPIEYLPLQEMEDLVKVLNDSGYTGTQGFIEFESVINKLHEYMKMLGGQYEAKDKEEN